MSMSISSNMPGPMTGGLSKPTSLTDDQINTISTVLADYDPDALTESDAQAIVQAFEEAGIQPGKALAEAMADAGFDARVVGETAGLQGPSGDIQGPPPPPSSSSGSGVNEGNLQMLQSILEQYSDLSELSDADKQTLTQMLSDAGLLEPGALINTTS